ncbi:MAG: hypothetical protein KKD31_15905 [Bacteroidetes bacterium]|nr:hypothetical protein [Bacteroidota bacterium]
MRFQIPDSRVIAPLQGVGVNVQGFAATSVSPTSRIIIPRGEIGVFAQGNTPRSGVPDSHIIPPFPKKITALPAYSYYYYICSSNLISRNK